MRQCPKCSNTTVADEGYCSTCNERTLQPVWNSESVPANQQYDLHPVTGETFNADGTPKVLVATTENRKARIDKLDSASPKVPGETPNQRRARLEREVDPIRTNKSLHDLQAAKFQLEQELDGILYGNNPVGKYPDAIPYRAGQFPADVRNPTGRNPADVRNADGTYTVAGETAEQRQVRLGNATTEIEGETPDQRAARLGQDANLNPDGTYATGKRPYVPCESKEKIESIIAQIEDLGDKIQYATDNPTPDELAFKKTTEAAQARVAHGDTVAETTVLTPTGATVAATDAEWQTGFDVAHHPTNAESVVAKSEDYKGVNASYYDRGYAATNGTNPYDTNSAEGKEWKRGYDAAHSQ